MHRSEICYPDMSDSAMRAIDLHMDHKFQALSSSVTDDRWVNVGGGVWVKAFYHYPGDDRSPPTLYMVHYSTEGRRFMVYRNLGPAEAVGSAEAL